MVGNAITGHFSRFMQPHSSRTAIGAMWNRDLHQGALASAAFATLAAWFPQLAGQFSTMLYAVCFGRRGYDAPRMELNMIRGTKGRTLPAGTQRRCTYRHQFAIEIRGLGRINRIWPVSPPNWVKRSVQVGLTPSIYLGG